MKAMIFSAGLGTRFKPWTDSHPKALAVVNGKTLLQRNVLYLQQYGIKDVVVNVHHFADQIEQAVKEAKGWGSNIIISNERDEVLETGGGLLKAKDFLSSDTFITLNADILTDLNLANFFAFHQQQKALISLAVSDRDTMRYLLFDDDARLCGWRNTDTEREKIVVQKDRYIQKGYSGIALFQPQVFNLITFTGKFSLIDVFLALAKEHKIVAYNHTGNKFIDVGKTENVSIAEALFS